MKRNQTTVIRMKARKYTLPLAMFLAAMADAPPVRADGASFGLDLRPFALQTFPNYLPSISKIPASARTVPINPSDAGAGTPILIPGSSVQPGPYVPLSLSAAPELRYKRFTLRAGLIWSPTALAPLASKCSCGSTQEVNYQGSGRTVGAALAFYSGEVRPSPVSTFGEVELRAVGPFSVLFGYRRATSNVSILTGWDRYNSLSSDQRIPLSSDEMDEPYAGIRFAWNGGGIRQAIILNGGPALVTKNPTALGKAAVLDYTGNPYFITVAFSLEFTRAGRR